MRLLFLLALAVLVAACTTMDMAAETIEGSGAASARTEDASGVRRVGLSAPGVLTIEVGRESGLRIEGDDNLVSQIVVEQEGDRLTIRTPRGTNFEPDLALRYTLGVTALDAVSVAGSGRIEATGVEAEAFAVEIAGSGDVAINRLDARSVEVNIAGSGNALLDGAAESVEVNIAGSGNADVGTLDAARAEVNIAGSGDAVLRVAERLEANIMGSGDVRYYGSPEITRSVAGSGEVVQAGD